MKDFVFIEGAAEHVQRPVATLRWWRANGLGPKSGKLGRRVVYKVADIEAWIESELEGSSK